MRAILVIAIVAVLGASVDARTIRRLKADRQVALQQQQQHHSARVMTEEQALAESQRVNAMFDIRVDGVFDPPALARCDHVSVGQAKCQQLHDAAVLGTTKLTNMIAYLDGHHKDAHFGTAFGAGADEATVRANLVKMKDGRFLLWNAYSNKDGSIYTGAGASWAGMGVSGKKLNVGPSSYSFSKTEMADHMIHEASHAFADTIDLHNGKNGYKDSVDFGTVKGANNADSYRYYAQLVSP